MRSALVVGLVVSSLAPVATADVIVHTGIVSGVGAPATQEVLIDQFDTLGGSRVLNSITIDFLTSLIGGYQTDGSGIPVTILAQLDANWSLAGQSLADTQALVSTTVPNTAPGSATVFNTDTAQVVFDQPADFTAWLGTGQTALTVFTQFIVTENPADIIFFGAGGTVRYTVTYDYSIVPAPGAIAMFTLAGLCARRRRR